jgi:hypothetical protein
VSNPLSELMPAKAGASACFGRDYDAAHLKTHPAQKTQSVPLSFKYEDGQNFPSVRVMLRQKGHEQPFYIVGSCSWEEHVNRDVKGKRFDAAFKKEAGVDCDAISAPSSAEESGDFLIDLAPDGRTLVLYLFDNIAAWSGTDQAHDSIALALDTEDLIFRLERTPSNACGAMEQELQTQ